MKKILLGLLCGVMILGVSTGCVKQDNGSDTENNSENSDGLTTFEKTTIYLSSESAVNLFEAVYYQLIFDNKGEPPTLSEVIDEFNNYKNSNLKANLETKNEILIENTLYDVSFKCEILYNQCKFKVICSEKETSYMELRDC